MDKTIKAHSQVTWLYVGEKAISVAPLFMNYARGKEKIHKENKKKIKILTFSEEQNVVFQTRISHCGHTCADFKALACSLDCFPLKHTILSSFCSSSNYFWLTTKSACKRFDSIATYPVLPYSVIHVCERVCVHVHIIYKLL